ncbi:MAG TPA: Vms1/Ankzf1 family peptidyl-tRNA hydrolase [Ilumatobacter sp.]|nr:Vms1/Ankzf1 family peptidyl-tRNA hydrolase [Ilumatobacter sp.]
MDHRRGTTTTRGGTLDDLEHLFTGERELLTVWANRPGPTPNEVSTRVRAEVSAAPGQWADTRDELAEAMTDCLTQAEAAVVVVAENVTFAEPLSDPLPTEARFTGFLPAISPVIANRQRNVPAVVVRLDRRGADLFWTGDDTANAMTVEGRDHFITKVSAGGWSQASYHRFAENAWERTATDTAQELEQIVTAIGARLVLLAADVRMAELLRGQVSPGVAAMLRDVAGARTEDGSDDHRDVEVDRWLRTAVAEDTVATLQAFDERIDLPDPLAVTGAHDTLAALRSAQVETLLVHDGGEDEPLGSFHPDDPTDIGHIEGGPSAASRTARRCDIAIRAALGTGATVKVVPRGRRLDDGLGALLRWAT